MNAESRMRVKANPVAATSSDSDYGSHTKAEAQPKARRTGKRAKQRERSRKIAKRDAARGVGRHYWLTPKVWGKPCSHCGHDGSVAYRPRDHKRACAECIERRGIVARESQSWRDGGSRAGAEVTVRYVEPETLRRATG